MMTICYGMSWHRNMNDDDYVVVIGVARLFRGFLNGLLWGAYGFDEAFCGTESRPSAVDFSTHLNRLCSTLPSHLVVLPSFLLPCNVMKDARCSWYRSGDRERSRDHTNYS